MERSRTAEQIFSEMHRQLRAFNPQTPESPERLDPILKMLMQMYAHQLARIDRRLDLTWDIATGALIKALSPESQRWPVPAYTVMRCRTTDPAVTIDPHTRFFHKERREGGQTFFFTALRSEKLLSVSMTHVFLALDDSLVDLSPAVGGARPLPVPAAVLPRASGAGRLYVAFQYPGRPTQFGGAVVYLKGRPEVQKLLRWARWNSVSRSGEIHEMSRFCPGTLGGIEQTYMSSRQEHDWGGLRTGADLFKPIEDSFLLLPESFASQWEATSPPTELTDHLTRNGYDPRTIPPDRYWLRLDLPPGGDKSALQEPFEICFDCFVAVNKSELKLFKHTGGSRLVELELPEPIDMILDITGIVDSNGREYVGVHEVQTDRSQRYYSLEERGERLVLWFDFSAGVDIPPDAISVTYSVTAGVSANAIAAGKIVDLYESHPGIRTAENIIPTTGAIPARTELQIITEASARLRSRDRALTFSEIANWARTFDPRIKRAVCENGVQRAERGVRRCIVVTAYVTGADFYSEDETSVLRTRLQSFLKSRSPVNTQFTVEIVKD